MPAGPPPPLSHCTSWGPPSASQSYIVHVGHCLAACDELRYSLPSLKDMPKRRSGKQAAPSLAHCAWRTHQGQAEQTNKPPRRPESLRPAAVGRQQVGYVSYLRESLSSSAPIF